MKEEKITVGDIVIITDESYVQKAAISGGLKLAVSSFKRDKTNFMVLATDCTFAKVSGQQDTPWQNNTVIQERDGDLVLFIEDDQLEKAETNVREVTMAEVCSQFGEDVKVVK